MSKVRMAWYLTDWKARYEPKVRNGKRLKRGLTYYVEPVEACTYGLHRIHDKIGSDRWPEIWAALGLFNCLLRITAQLPEEWRGFLLTRDLLPHSEATLGAVYGMSEAEFSRFFQLLRTARWLSYKKLPRNRHPITETVTVTETVNSSVRDTALEGNRDSAGARRTHKRVSPIGSKSNGPQSLSGILGSGFAGAAAGKNGGASSVEIVALLADRGCDPSFRGLVSKRADAKLIRRLAQDFDQNRTDISNPGGWWREALRREGVKGI